ncbi:putative ATPGTP-binding integral membrane protein [Mycobacterium avium subsp. paratuberculosis MAP4]|nr:putative ATPGTP-binding integral membrane protein [Mycobacterium avium subsp. paratuberculosis MAP4]
MHGSGSASASAGVAHLVDRHPTVSPQRLIAQLRPPPTFADVSFATYQPDPAEPTQATAVAACREFCRQAVQRRAGRRKLLGRREILPGVGLYLDGGFGVGKTHLLAPAPPPLSDAQVAARAAVVPGATLDDFDALCAHLATMHPSRYLTLIEGVTAVFLTGVHRIDDQNVALRLVSLTDRLYDAGVPVLASGEKLDTIFSAEMLSGGYRKKYLRAMSRLLALTAGANEAYGS